MALKPERRKMRTNIKYLTGAYLLFLVLLLCSSYASGIFSEIVYYSSFILPVFAVIYLKKSAFENPFDIVKIKKERLDTALALSLPGIGVIMGISALTTLIFDAFGLPIEEVSTEPHFLLSVLNLALLPAIGEELLFRYLPMKLILPHSPRVCVLLSAVMFSMAHTSIEAFAYAFAAGVFFMVIDICSGSILPSVIAHFINNVISLMLIYFDDNNRLIIGFYVMFSLLLIISLVYFALKRKKIISKIYAAFSAGEPMGADLVPLAFILPCLLLAIENLL